MPVIIIENLFRRKLEIADPSDTILKHFQMSGIDWMQACGGKGRCTTCRFVVVEGVENLAPLTSPEQKYRAQGALKDSERLACQARPCTGTVTIRVPEDTQLPHLKYSG